MKRSFTARTIPCLLFFFLAFVSITDAQQALHRFAGIQGYVADAAFSKDGSLLLVTTDKGLTICDANTEQARTTIPFNGKITAALSPDNHTLLVAGNSNELGIYTIQDSAAPSRISNRKLQTHINTLDFRADGRYYAIGTDDGRVAVMDAQRPDAFATIMEAIPFADRKAGGVYTNVSNLRFIDNDRLMVFAGNGEVKAFDVNSGRQVYALEYYHNVIYAPADDTPVQCDIAPRAGKLLCSRSGNAFILDLETYNIVGKTAQTGLRTSAIAPSGNMVLACDATNVYVFNGDLSHSNNNVLSLSGIAARPDVKKVLISPAANKIVICSGSDLLIADYQSFQRLTAK